MSEDGFDAAAAAAQATGEDAGAETVDGADGSDTTAPDPSLDEGGGGDSTSALREALMSTDPDPPLETVDTPFDPDTGGLARIYRGIQKAVGIDGTPAIVDLGIGLVEELSDRDVDVGGGDQEDSDDGGAGPAGEDVI